MKKLLKIFFILILIGCLLGGFYFFIYPKLSNKLIPEKEFKKYLSSDLYTVKLYNFETFEEVKEVVRGTEVIVYENEIKQEIEGKEPIIYNKIKIDGKTFLVKPSNIVDKYEDSVIEEEIFVRTNVTVYEAKDKIDILGYVKKGEKLEITGFDKINEDGSVNKYKVKYNDSEGYVYSKYLVLTEEEAKKNYDEENTYKIHAARTNRYGGGSGDNLDYYPVDKPSFENNKLLESAKTLYLNSGVLGNIDAYITLAKNTGINAFVVDVKENTAPAYKSEVMNEYTKTTYDKGIQTRESNGNVIKKLKDEGFYVIGRITTFKDSYYINDNPGDAITSTHTGNPYKHNGSYWPSPYVRNVWEYNVKLAVDAVEKFGFNEIQFDYMRFPDRTVSIENQGLVDMKNTYGETKAQVLQNFMFYACDAIHEKGAYVSVDVFGESANTYVTAYGQYWPAISNVVDVISAMPYPDHFSAGQYGLATPWTQPYTLMKLWATDASNRQKEIPTPAIGRTWIQAYNAIKSPYNTYTSVEIKNQIQGLLDGGLTGGFITWNGSSNITKYQSISSGW